MELSKRLSSIVDLIEKDKIVADIGTDHGYIPIYLIKNNICKYVIASDINKGPIEILKKNIKEHNILRGIEIRLGSGFETLNENEVNVAIIAGMGGNLIADIIDNSYNIAKSLDYMILQPAQHQEVLRKYLYNKGFEIIQEDIVYDAEKYYHTMKVSIGSDIPYKKEVEYYIGRKYREKTNDFKGYVKNKIDSIEKIIKFTEKANDKERYNYLKNLLKEFKEVMENEM